MSVICPAQEAPAASNSEGLVAIPVNALRTNCLQCDIYIQRESCGVPILYRRESHPLTEADLDRLVKRGIQTLYITKSHEATFRQRMYEEVCQNESVPLAERYKVLSEINKTEFDKNFRNGKLEDVIYFNDGLGNKLSELVCRQDLIVDELFSMMEFDNGTYTHSINVATYSLILANRLGIRDTPELQSIATGALLHDIGKRHVQLAILNKPGPLSEQQRNHIEQHPTMGFLELAQREDLTWGQIMMVYQHHERVDGSGYPTGIKDKEIHPWARICSIADIFHALTSARPYKAPMSTDAALEVLGKQSGKTLDKEMVECWHTTVKTIHCLKV